MITDYATALKSALVAEGWAVHSGSWEEVKKSHGSLKKFIAVSLTGADFEIAADSPKTYGIASQFDVTVFSEGSTCTPDVDGMLDTVAEDIALCSVNNRYFELKALSRGNDEALTRAWYTFQVTCDFYEEYA